MTNDKEYQREYMKRYRAEHPERVNQASKRWRERNPDKVKDYNKRRKEDKLEHGE